MNISATAVLLLAVGVLLANMPFVSKRFFVIFYQPHKPVRLALLEWAAFYLVFILIGLWIEPDTVTRPPLGWSFFVLTFTQFALLATPGFVWRVLRRRRLS